MRRRSRSAGWGALLMAGLACAASLFWLVYSFRAVSVACTRVGGPPRCSTIERVVGREVWVAAVGDVRAARSVARTASGPRGVVLETGAGERLALTSSVLGSDQTEAIAGRIQQWLLDTSAPETLDFVQGPSVANFALSAGIALLAGLWGAGVGLRLRQRRTRRAH